MLKEPFQVFHDQNLRPWLILGGEAGSWCLVAKLIEVNNVLLIDKCPLTQVIGLMASSSHLRWDLKNKIPEVARYDLAISNEFIQNLTEMQGKLSIKRFCESSKTILFSAAIPG